MYTACDKCGAVGIRLTGVPNGDGSFSWYCKHDLPKMFRETNGAAYNPYDLTLDHVYDENGHKVHVSSKKEMLEAEKKYKFRHIVTHYDDGEKKVEDGNEPKWAKHKVKQPHHGRGAMSHEPIFPLPEEALRTSDARKSALWEYLDSSKSETPTTP